MSALVYDRGLTALQVYAALPQGCPDDEADHRGEQPDGDGDGRALCDRIRGYSEARLVEQGQEVRYDDPPMPFRLAVSYLLSQYSAGPIIEQGTHFCDLSRYFGGDVDISSVSAHSLEWYEEAGHLSKMVIDESQIAPENRVPRATVATWCVLPKHV